MVEAEHSAKDVDLLQSMAADLRRRNYSNKLLRIVVAAGLDEIEEIASLLPFRLIVCGAMK